ncbi:hypothetical protein WR25_13230 [Diploscapter pachys]|uniref:Uncharacterized protein n=1 Tax=Diploscapter pachys TaxID=2018661 RepID=A0A2A2K390_9BILA|nr:hypothetical protein WR25_13230 [Diploscapter pachys]
MRRAMVKQRGDATGLHRGEAQRATAEPRLAHIRTTWVSDRCIPITRQNERSIVGGVRARSSNSNCRSPATSTLTKACVSSPAPLAKLFPPLSRPSCSCSASPGKSAFHTPNAEPFATAAITRST